MDSCFRRNDIFRGSHKKYKLRFLNQNWEEEVWELEDDLSELFQHEVDHLDGILAINEPLIINPLPGGKIGVKVVQRETERRNEQCHTMK
jgi:hypothetical protein